MSRRFYQVGQSLRGDSKETEQNTRRIAAKLPFIERKLDVLSTDTSYKLDFPISARDHSVHLNIQLKPDNCCDCIPGAEAAARYATGWPEYFWNVPLTKVDEGLGLYHWEPPHIWENGVDYPAVYHNPLDTQGTITNIWFAWEGYPFFYPTITNTWGYGQFTPSDAPAGGIVVPTNGVYTMIFRDRAGGSTTDTSQIVASIKRLPKELQDHPEDAENWQTISRKIYSTVKQNICAYIFKSWADMWDMIYDPKDNIEVNNEIFVKACASYGHNFSFDPTVIEQLGGLYIVVYAYCFPLNEGDIVGGWLQATDVNDWQPGEGNAEANLTMIDLIGLGFGALTGRVYHDNTGLPLEGVSVVASDGSTSFEEFTNDEGRYTFYELNPKITYTVTASKSGYQDQVKSATIIFNKLIELDFNIMHI